MIGVRCLTAWAWASVVSVVPAAVIAQHENDALFGFEGRTLKVMQPTPQPVRQMSALPGVYLTDIGLDFFTPEGWLHPMLQECRVVGVYISPTLVGTKTGVGNVFCSSGCPNYFDLPYAGTPHHHFKFSVPGVPGVYVWDMKAINGFDYLGNSLQDMPNVYRYYMVAGNPNRIRGAVAAAPQYGGDLGKLSIRIQLRSGNNVVAVQEQPVCSGVAAFPYMVGFTQSGTYDVVGKLSKHLSIRVPDVTLSTNTILNWQFLYVGDLDGDDIIGLGDLNRVLVLFGTTNDDGDVNGDGSVTLADPNIVLLNFGRSGQGV